MCLSYFVYFCVDVCDAHTVHTRSLFVLVTLYLLALFITFDRSRSFSHSAHLLCLALSLRTVHLQD